VRLQTRLAAHESQSASSNGVQVTRGNAFLLGAVALNNPVRVRSARTIREAAVKLVLGVYRFFHEKAWKRLGVRWGRLCGIPAWRVFFV